MANNITWADRTDNPSIKKTGATYEVDKDIMNGIKNFINEPAQSGTTFDDSGSITVDGTKVYSTTRSVTASTHSLTIAATGHKSNNYIHARYSFSQACTITLNNFDSTLNSTGTINPIPAGTYDFFFMCVNSALGVSLIIPNNLNSTVNQLSTPSNFTATGGDTVVYLSWNAVSNATSYTLEFHTGDNNWTSVPGYTSGITATHTSLTNGSSYYYRAKATASGYTDSSYATTTGIPSGAFIPTDLGSKLINWWRGQVVNASGTDVTSWPDQKGSIDWPDNGNSAQYDSVNDQIEFTATSSHALEIDTNVSTNFNQSTGEYWLCWDHTNNRSSVLFSLSRSDDNDYFLMIQTTTGNILTIAHASGPATGETNNSTTTLNVGKNILRIEASGSGYNIELNGVDISSEFSGATERWEDDVTARNRASIAALRRTTSVYQDLDIHEFLRCDDTLTAGEVTNVYNYLDGLY